MKKQHLIIAIVGILACIVSTSCKKFLEEKPDKKLTTPTSIEDLQPLLDNISIMNRGSVMTQNGSDEYYITSSDWSASVQVQRESYVWDPNTQNDEDWNALYRVVFYSNTVLENIEKIPSVGVQTDWNNIKGSALFFRAHAFFHLAQTFAQPYDPGTATTDLGIPLRLNPDFSVTTTRSTLKETYDRILSDLNSALGLLPITPQFKTRPGKPALFSMLARTYLVMGDYAKAGLYADSCLQLYNTLLNYATDITPGAATPFTRFNPEVIFYCNTSIPITAAIAKAKIDSTLFNSFSTNDWRKTAFFRANTGTAAGTYGFKGSYNQSTLNIFNGIAVDEVYLMRAECSARAGNTNASMNDLHTLLIKRWKTGTFVPFAPTTPVQALGIILTERKKELIYRGSRWWDLRRLNKEGVNIIQTRNINGQTYTLPPNDLRYSWLIPESVIALTGIVSSPFFRTTLN